jgi:phage baseplate assembly protein W
MSAADQAKAFLGVGWKFVPCVTKDGRIALVRYENDIREAILIILGTDLGERVMRPDFGAGLNDFVFEPLNSTTLHLVQTRVQEALVTWEPRIDVLDVSVSADTSEHNKLLISVTYRVRATNTQFNLVYPFYLEEGTAG